MKEVLEMTVATYAPRVSVHDDRFGSIKTQGPNIWAVLHTTEGSELTSSAEQLATFLGYPGDRPNGRGGFYGSSYHAIFDTDQVIPAVPYDTVAYSAGGGNARGVHAVFPGKAGQTRDQWLDTNSRAMIRQAAAWLVDVSAEEGIPLQFIGSDEVANYGTGICDHRAITYAFRKSTHTDVGPDFPWDVLAADIAELTQPAPPNGDEMTTLKRPVRLIDTRKFSSNPIAAGAHEFETPAVVPVTQSLTLTVTAVDPTGDGFATVWNGEGSVPEASCLNYRQGENIANTTAVAVKGRKFKVYLHKASHLILDVVGYV